MLPDGISICGLQGRYCLQELVLCILPVGTAHVACSAGLLVGVGTMLIAAVELV